MSDKSIYEALLRLQTYCETEEYQGYDPYDGLTSLLFKSLPFIRQSRMARLLWIQAFKQSPINMRPLFRIKKDFNPKALGLFLSGYVNLYKLEQKEEYIEKIRFLAQKILSISSKGYSGMCWGYNFDWESRAFFLPAYTPTVVVSSFVANALLDCYEIISDKRLLDAARSTCDFILKDLNRSYNEDGSFMFSYSKFDNSGVFNSSLLGSKLLARVYSVTGEQFLLEEATRSVSCVCSYQHENGSWPYGKQAYHQWIDSFHTGFNLEAISDFIKYTGDLKFKDQLNKGYDYYSNTFFLDEGIAKYYNNRIYPVDIHAPAQLIITVCKLGRLKYDRELTSRALDWVIANMQSPRGFFFYQTRKYYKIKIPYMRWSQAWMFYALSTYLLSDMKEGI
jgi:hypothetical protein